MSKRKVTLFRLWTAHLAAIGAPAVLLAVMVLIGATVVSAVPGALAHVGAAQLHHEIDLLSPRQRYVTARTQAQVPFGPAPVTTGSPPLRSTTAATWGQLDAALAELRRQAPTPLRNHLGPAIYIDYSAIISLQQPPYDPNAIGQFRLVLAADPRYESNGHLVAGTWPSSNGAAETGGVVDIALSEPTAIQMGWAVGAIRHPASGGKFSLPFRLTGTFQAAPATTDYWILNPSILLPRITQTPNNQIVTGTAYVDPASWPALSELSPGGDFSLYYPFDVTGVKIAQAELLRSQLAEFTNPNHPLDLPSPVHPGAISSLRLGSGSPATLTATLIGTHSADAVLTLLVIGPCGVAFVAVLITTQLLIRRRRRHFVLLRARGIPPGVLRIGRAAEGATLTIPAAAVGTAAAFLTLPPDSWWPAVLLPVALVASPIAMMTSSVIGLTSGRADLTRRSSRLRILLELIIVVFAVASTLLLYRSDPGRSGGLDPLVALAPLLLTGAACVVLLRILPVALQLVMFWSSSGRSTVTFVGSARAVREPLAGIASLVAMVAAVAMTVLSAVLLATVQHGITSAASASVGADLKIQQVGLQPDQIAAVAAVPGIGKVAAVTTQASVQVTIGGLPRSVTMYFVDTADLPAAQSGVAGAVPIPAALTALHGHAVPVLTSSGLEGQSLAVTGHSLIAVGSAPRATGIGTASDWLLVDVKFLPDFVETVALPDTLLAQLAAGFDATTIEKAVTTALPDAVQQTPGDLSTRLNSAPIVGDVGAFQRAALIVMGLFGAMTVLVSSIAATRNRHQLLAILRTLGLRRGAATLLIVWEFLPPAVAAIIGGTALGLGLTGIVTDVVDLRPFTGGDRPPALSVQPLMLAALLGVLLLIIAVAVCLNSARAARVDLAAEIGNGDQ